MINPFFETAAFYMMFINTECDLVTVTDIYKSIERFRAYLPSSSAE